MATFKRFEDIDAWQKARALARDIYILSGSGEFSKDFSFRDQIRRAGVSIMANIAEGFERGGNKEFVQFPSIAKASSAEFRSHLYIALDENYIKKEQFEKLYNDADDISKIISGLIQYLISTDLKGTKYKIQKHETLNTKH